MIATRLGKFNTGDYFPGGLLRRVIWYITNVIFFNTPVPFPSVVKANILRAFGADVGRGVVIKPYVNIKYPWFLVIGSDCWIGEGYGLTTWASWKLVMMCVFRKAVCC